MEIENDRIVASLTVGEYKEVLNAVLKDHVKEKEGPHEYGFGLKCIEEHFGVSKGTAQTYKDTFSVLCQPFVAVTAGHTAARQEDQGGPDSGRRALRQQT